MKNFKLTITDDDNNEHQVAGCGFIEFMYAAENLFRQIDEIEMDDSLEVNSSEQNKILSWAGE